MIANTQYPDIFGALAERFPDGQVKERPGGRGKTLHYITARTVMNRLDEVLGPERWSDRYYEVCNVLFCEITVTLPDGTKISKADGGGFKEMTEGGKVDQENTDKTGPSDAFKRAAAKYGVGRYLYKDGSADFGGSAPTEARPTQAPATSAPNGGRNGGRELCTWATREGAAIKKNLLKWLKLYGEKEGYPEQIVDWNPDQSDAAYAALAKKLNAEADKAPASPAPATNGTATDGQTPRTGRALFAWTKEQEQRHEVGLLKYINGWANLQDFPGRMVDFTAEQTRLAHAECVRKLKDAGTAASYEEALAN